MLYLKLKTTTKNEEDDDEEENRETVVFTVVPCHTATDGTLRPDIVSETVTIPQRAIKETGRDRHLEMDVKAGRLADDVLWAQYLGLLYHDGNTGRAQIGIPLEGSYVKAN